jgi:hypothetical protein
MRQSHVAYQFPNRSTQEVDDPHLRPFSASANRYALRSGAGPAPLLPRKVSACAPNTLVSAGLQTLISLLKTPVSAHTVNEVLVSRECRFVWQ